MACAIVPLIPPLTVSVDSVPTLVMFGWFELVSVPVNAPLKVPPVAVPANVILPIVALTVLNVFDVILPVTVSALKLPSVVILFSVPGASIPLNVPPTMLPVTVIFCTPLILVIVADAELKLPADTNPVTVKLLKVPTVVMFG